MSDQPKTVTLSSVTHKKLKAEAVSRQIKLKDFLEQVIETGLSLVLDGEAGRK